MATARDDNIDAQPSETDEADSAAIMSSEADEFLQSPIEGVAAQLAERFHRHHDKRGLRVIFGYDVLARSS